MAFQRQRRLAFYDGDASDEDDLVKQEGVHFQKGSRSKGQKTTEGNSEVTTPATSVEGGDTNEEEAFAANLSNVAASSSSLRDSAEHAMEITVDSPFLPVKSFDFPSVPEHHLSLKELRETPVDSKGSPKLEHKAVTRVKSLMSIECQGVPRQKNEELSASNKPINRRTPQRAQKSEVQERLVRPSCSEAVTLTRKENESFGLDLEIHASPLRVVITGLRPGGAAERVMFGVLSLTFSSCSESFVFSDGILTLKGNYDYPSTFRELLHGQY